MLALRNSYSKTYTALSISRLALDRSRLGIPCIALVGYTNAGKSTLMNRLSNAGVLAEDMLFATLDPTTRKTQLPARSGSSSGSNSDSSNNNSNNNRGAVMEVDGQNVLRSKGLEVMLSDTVGFISKLPTSLIAAFRSTLEEVNRADILVRIDSWFVK